MVLSELDKIRDRVTRLERDMVDVRGDAAAARVLAGGADRDVSQMRDELRSHTRTLNALRETQLEQGQQIAELRSDVSNGFSTVGAGMAQITASLTTHLRECPGEA